MPKYIIKCGNEFYVDGSTYVVWCDQLVEAVPRFTRVAAEAVVATLFRKGCEIVELQEPS